MTLNSEENIGFAIDFPLAAGGTGIDRAEMVYDMGELKKQIPSEDVYVYLNPQNTDYKIADALGFDTNDFAVEDSGERTYMKGNSVESGFFLRIDKFGTFTYKTNSPDTFFEMPYSENECVQIAKAFLEKYDLWDKEQLDESRVVVNNTSIGAEGNMDERITIGHDVYFHAKQTDGLEVFGNARVIVEINGNGEVRSVTYSLRRYEDRQKADLISLEEAFQRIDDRKAFIEVESDSAKLIFEKVILAYWTQNRNEDNLVMQPVYAFQGTSVTLDGEEEPFAITVQANRVS
jgi:hypothetical protein